MDVVGNAGAGGTSGVGADVESLWRHHVFQDRDRLFRRAHDVGRLVVIERFELADVRRRGDHGVPGVVGEAVEEHDRALGAPDDQLGVLVVGVLEHAAEKAAGPLLAADVLHAPGRPQTIH